MSFGVPVQRDIMIDLRNDRSFLRISTLIVNASEAVGGVFFKPTQYTGMSRSIYQSKIGQKHSATGLLCYISVSRNILGLTNTVTEFTRTRKLN